MTARKATAVYTLAPVQVIYSFALDSKGTGISVRKWRTTWMMQGRTAPEPEKWTFVGELEETTGDFLVINCQEQTALSESRYCRVVNNIRNKTQILSLYQHLTRPQCGFWFEISLTEPHWPILTFIRVPQRVDCQGFCCYALLRLGKPL